MCSCLCTYQYSYVIGKKSSAVVCQWLYLVLWCHSITKYAIITWLSQHHVDDKPYHECRCHRRLPGSPVSHHLWSSVGRRRVGETVRRWDSETSLTGDLSNLPELATNTGCVTGMFYKKWQKPLVRSVGCQ